MFVKPAITRMFLLLLLFFLPHNIIFAERLFKSLDETIPLDQSISKGILHNGLTYYVRENRKPEERIILRLIVNAGSILENEKQRGLAHFLEHMAFNGTENFPGNTLVDLLEREGIKFGPDLNAYTSYDSTVYMLDIPAGREELLDSALLILRDWATGITNTPEEIEKERGVVIEEWRKSRGARARIGEIQRKEIFGDSRYAERAPIGEISILETFGREELVSFYKDWYRPDLMAVIAVGDFDGALVEEKIKKSFDTIPLQRLRKKRVEYSVPDRAADMVSIVTDSEAVSAEIRILYLFENPEQDSVGDYKDGIASSLFFSMLNNRFEEKRQERNPPCVRAVAGAGRLVSTKSAFSVVSTADPEKITGALSAVAEELSRVKHYGFTESEFARAKERYARLMLQLYREAENTKSETLAAEYTRNFLEGEYVPGIEYEYMLAMELLDLITLEDMKDLSTGYIRDGGALIQISKPESAPALAESSLLSVFRDTLSSVPEPYVDMAHDGDLVDELPSPGKARLEKHDENKKILYYALSNGARLIIKQTDFKNDQVLFEAFSPGGHSLVSDDEWVSANLASAIVSRGVIGGLKRVQLDKYLEGKVVNVSPYIGETIEGFTGSSSVSDLETLFQLIYLYFTAAEKDEDSFHSYVSRIETYFRNQDASPDFRFGQTLMRLLSSSHPRGRAFDISIIPEIDHDKAYSVFRNRFGDPGSFTYVFTGSAPAEMVVGLAEKYIAFSTDVSSTEETWADTGIRLPEGVVEETIYMGKEEKSQIAVVFNGDFEWSRENLLLLTALTEAANIRLRNAIREDEGGTYSISVYPSVEKYPVPQYQITVYFACDPARAEDLKNIVLSEIKSLRERIPEGTIQKFHNASFLELRKQLKENSFWLSAIKDSEIDSSGLEWLNIYEIMIENINEDDIMNAASRYFNMERYIDLTMYPESMEK